MAANENPSRCEILEEKARKAHALALRLDKSTREKLASIMPYLGYEADGFSFYKIACAIFSYGVDALSRLSPIEKKKAILKQLKANQLKSGRPLGITKS